MFSSKERLDKKTGPYGIGRFSFLQQLITEFQDTDSEGAKQEVLANLANFAYDPINYEYLRRLNVIDLFLDNLTDSPEILQRFAIGGICNLCLDKINKEEILKKNGVQSVIQCLSSPDEETVVSAITTLMFLVTPASKPDITALPVIDCMLRFAQSNNKRLSNLANVFLQDYCHPKQIEKVLESGPSQQVNTPQTS